MKNYSKPELSILGAANAVIQDTTKTGSRIDSDGSGSKNQAPAYDLDE